MIELATVLPPLASCVSTGIVLLTYGAWNRSVRHRTLAILGAGVLVHWLLLVSLRLDSLFVPATVGMFYVSSYLGPPALSWVFWLSLGAAVMLQDHLLKQPGRGLHLFEVLLTLLCFWTAFEPIIRLVLLGLHFLSDPATGAFGSGEAAGPLPNLWAFRGALLAPATAGLLWGLVRLARRNLMANRKTLAAALVAFCVLAAEPCSLLVGAALVPPPHHGPGREPPNWKTAGSLRIVGVAPETDAYVELTDVFGLIRFQVVRVQGDGFRLVTVRAPGGWLPVRWLVMWE